MMASSVQVVAAAVLLLLLTQLSSASFGARDPPPLVLREAQAACVKYLGLCENRLCQYNNSIYPPDQDTMCVVRCAGIMIGFWDDRLGFKLDGLVNLYPELAADACAQHQILSCAEKRMVSCPPQDSCAKAYNGFRCFLEAQKRGFGMKDAQSQQQQQQQSSKSFDAQEFMRSLTICAKIQRVSDDLRKLYGQGVFPNDEQTRGVIRCIGIRTGLYDDAQGPNFPQLYRLFGAGKTEAEFRRRADLCIKANQPLLDGQDKNAQAYVKLYRCFADQFSALIRANANAMAA